MRDNFKSIPRLRIALGAEHRDQHTWRTVESPTIKQAPSTSLRRAPSIVGDSPYLLGGIAIGCTLPQSGPLYVAVDIMVMFIVLGPIAIDI